MQVRARSCPRASEASVGGGLCEPYARSEAEAVAFARSGPPAIIESQKGKQTRALGQGPSYSAAPEALQLQLPATIAKMGLRQSRRRWEEPVVRTAPNVLRSSALTRCLSE